MEKTQFEKEEESKVAAILETLVCENFGEGTKNDSLSTENSHLKSKNIQLRTWWKKCGLNLPRKYDWKSDKSLPSQS